MPHIFELATTGRSKCRGCGLGILRGELRFGERLPSSYADGDMTHWFHPLCAAYKRPEPLLEALPQSVDLAPDREALARVAQASLAPERRRRIDGAEHARGQATCRQCRTPIPRGDWRIRLSSYDEGQFSPLGFIHLACANDYFETSGILDQVLHFSPALSNAERQDLRSILAPT